MTIPRFGLTLPNRGVLFGVETIRDLIEMAEVADASGLFQGQRGRYERLAREVLPAFAGGAVA